LKFEVAALVQVDHLGGPAERRQQAAPRVVPPGAQHHLRAQRPACLHDREDHLGEDQAGLVGGVRLVERVDDDVEPCPYFLR
jgi:hypothetical protein